MKKVICFSILFLTINLYSQSPWTQEKGKLYTQLSFSTVANYDELFGNPDYSVLGTYSDNTLQFYGAYGITDKTSIILNFPLKIISINDFKDPRINCVGDCSQDYEKTSLGNIEIGLKHVFYKKDWVLSGQFSLEANTNSYDTVSGIRTGYDAFTFTPLLLAGKGFGKTYIQGFIGASIRTNNYSSNFKIGGELGRKITKNIWLIGFLDIVKSFENGTIILPTSNLLTGLYVNNQEYGSFGAKFIGEFSENFGITGGFGGAFFGKNVAKQAALTFGLYHKF